MFNRLVTQKDAALREKIMELRSQGKSFGTIAQEVDRTRQRIHQIVKDEEQRDD